MIATLTQQVAGHRQRSSNSRGRSSRARSQRCSQAVGSRHLRTTYDPCNSPELVPQSSHSTQVEQAVVLRPLAIVEGVMELEEISDRRTIQETRKLADKGSTRDSASAPSCFVEFDTESEELEEILEDGPLDLELPSFVRDFLQQHFHAEGMLHDCLEEPCLVDELDFVADHAIDVGALIASAFLVPQVAKDVSEAMDGTTVFDIENVPAEDVAKRERMVEVCRSGPFGADLLWYPLLLDHREPESASTFVQATGCLEVKGAECQRTVMVCRSGPFGTDSSTPVWYALAVDQSELENIPELTHATGDALHFDHTQVESASAAVQAIGCLEVEGAEYQRTVVVCRSGPFGSDSASPVWHTLAVDQGALQSTMEPTHTAENVEVEGAEYNMLGVVCQFGSFGADSSTLSCCPLPLDQEKLEKAPLLVSASDSLEDAANKECNSRAVFESVTQDLAAERADVAAIAGPCETTWAGSLACALRSRRVAKREAFTAKKDKKDGITVFALDVGEGGSAKFNGAKRESSLVRGYDFLGVEWHSMDRDDDDDNDVRESQAIRRTSPSQRDRRSLSCLSSPGCPSVATRPATCVGLPDRCAQSTLFADDRHECSSTGCSLAFDVASCHLQQRREEPTFRASSAGALHRGRRVLGLPLKTSPPLLLKEGQLAFQFAKGIPKQRVSCLSRALSWSRQGPG